MPRPTIILFGATGDLAGHKLFPALEAIHAADPSRAARILAVGRREHDGESFRAYLRPLLADDGGFLATVEYLRMDMLEASDYAALAGRLAACEESGCDRAFYLAIPPERYPEVLGHLAASGLAKEDGGGFRRLVVEKPFGTDRESARRLDALIAESFREDQVYRIDHYLGKETVQNVLAFRFANRFLEPAWSREHIDHVQVTVAESEGIRSRAPYYDATGAFRDLMQNHVLQLLTVLALEEPESFSFDGLSDRKAEVLRAVSADPAAAVFGQYDGYRGEPGVRPDSSTETYAMAELSVRTPRWEGVPFYLRTGKRLAAKVSEITVQFKPSAAGLFRSLDGAKAANLLTFRIQPDEGIFLRMAVKSPRRRDEVRPVRMEFCYGTSFKERLPDAYELIFQDLLAGERIHTLRADCIEESWRIVDGILGGKPLRPLHAYAPGSWGPAAADAYLEERGRRWLASETEVCNGVTMEQ